MMQPLESYNQKNSLFNAMTRFIGAVNNMDQTVMVPSLLRDVPLDDDDHAKVAATTASASANGSAYLPPDGDMYSSYVLLKSIRDDMEWGVVQGDERRRDKATTGVVTAVATAAAEDDLEKQFHFHLKGLQTVLTKLTRKADMLTSRYQDEIVCRN